jgi:sulfofructose kinase
VSSPSDARSAGPVVLCAGIAVQDLVFRVERFPPPGGKIQAQDFVIVGGGCAANAAVAIARLGGRARYAGPLGGPAGGEPLSDRLLAYLAAEGVTTEGVVRVDGVTAPVSAIFIDANGEKMIATRRDPKLTAARLGDPEALVADIAALLVDNRYPDFVLPLCRAARRHGRPVVIDADKITSLEDPLLAAASHVIFSAECLLGTTEMTELEPALRQAAARTGAFIAVTNGPDDVLWIETLGLRRMPVFTVATVDTLAAGDVFHGAFALAIAEGGDEPAAMRFAAAASALKCARFGGIAGAPNRAKVDALLAATVSNVLPKIENFSM